MKIIAEIGINHNGDLNIAKELITIAADAGCDVVKFQKRDIDLVYSKEFLAEKRESPWGSTQRAQKEGLELSETSYKELLDFCIHKNIDMMISAWDLNSQRFVNSLDLQYQKIASPMLTHTELLRMVASTRKYTFISTGMSSLNEIEAAVSIFNRYETPYELMHCVSIYPLPVDYANLKRIEYLREYFKCNVGYSGHEVGLAPSLAAVMMGITSLERHITLDRSMYGSDQSASLEPSGLRRLVRYCKDMLISLGTGEIEPSLEELNVATKLKFRSDK